MKLPQKNPSTSSGLVIFTTINFHRQVQNKGQEKNEGKSKEHYILVFSMTVKTDKVYKFDVKSSKRFFTKKLKIP